MENCRKYWKGQDADRSLQKGLVAFLNHNDHFNVDYNEANELPDRSYALMFFSIEWSTLAIVSPYFYFYFIV